MSFLEGVIEFYGNRGIFFDLLLSAIISVVLILLNFPLDFLNQLSDSRFESIISFFGILVGFLLTTFSLLFLYNPEHSESLTKMRKHRAYKTMLYSFISTSFFIIILTLSFLAMNYIPYSYVIFPFMVFVIIRLLKCLFYLYRIISIS